MPARQRSGVSNTDKPKKDRTNYRMRSETIQRLHLECLMSGKDPGDVLSDLVDTHCRNWKVQVNHYASGKASDRPEFTEGMSAPALNPS